MQLSQNIKALLQEIGESSVLLQLSMRLHQNKRWKVYRNYTEQGCDIVVVGNERIIKVEVKTRQGVITKNTQRPDMHFTVTEGEKNSSDFVVAYWFDRAAYFILPTSKLKPYKAGTKIVYKFIPRILRSGDYSDDARDYLEAWRLILDELK